jgi:hypothetical protein
MLTTELIPEITATKAGTVTTVVFGLDLTDYVTQAEAAEAALQKTSPKEKFVPEAATSPQFQQLPTVNTTRIATMANARQLSTTDLAMEAAHAGLIIPTQQPKPLLPRLDIL